MATVAHSPPAADTERNRLLWAFCATIFVSAFLLFQVQPLISKMILPWFGGSPAVWTTCMLFFQVMLVAGYGYAHLLINFVPPRYQSIVHVGLLAISLPLAYIVPNASWKPEAAENPTWQIMLLLGACLGLPYFLLSSTGPLLQAWYARVYPNESPYRLYALSNVGSLAALLTFPFVFEPLFSLGTLGWEWGAGFWLFAFLAGGIAVYLWSSGTFDEDPVTAQVAASQAAMEPKPSAESESAFDSDFFLLLPLLTLIAAGVSYVAVFVVGDIFQKLLIGMLFIPLAALAFIRRVAIWILLPALAVVVLLAVTSHVCQDVAVVPLLYIVPLALYLITFIIAFDSDGWYIRPLFATGAILGIVFVSMLMIDYKVDRVLEPIREWWNGALPLTFPKIHSLRENFVIESMAYFVTLFCIAMVCHGELAARKPEAKWLTGYFLCIACGGAFGGIIVAIICPLIFRSYLELNFSFVGGLLVGIVALGTFVVQAMPAVSPPIQPVAPKMGSDENNPSPAPRFVSGAPNLNVLFLRTALGVLAISILCVVGVCQYLAAELTSVETVRTFYGVLSVTEEKYWDETTVGGNPSYTRNAEYDGLALRNGRILHGFQYTDVSHRHEATTYYIPDSGLGRAIDDYALKGRPVRVAIVGLGTGTAATYCRQGDVYRFYEINPVCEQIARKYFTYLKDAEMQGTVEVVLGDARISMEREENQNYDIIGLDAFSGDAIPAHLLTVESFELYLRHLNPKGTIAVHVSNRYLDLIPVCRAIAKHHGMEILTIDADEPPYGNDSANSSSTWVLVTKDPKNLDTSTLLASEESKTSEDDPENQKMLLWTDGYSDLFSILKTGFKERDWGRFVLFVTSIVLFGVTLVIVSTGQYDRFSIFGWFRVRSDEQPQLFWSLVGLKFFTALAAIILAFVI